MADPFSCPIALASSTRAPAPPTPPPKKKKNKSLQRRLPALPGREETGGRARSPAVQCPLPSVLLISGRVPYLLELARTYLRQREGCMGHKVIASQPPRVFPKPAALSRALTKAHRGAKVCASRSPKVGRGPTTPQGFAQPILQHMRQHSKQWKQRQNSSLFWHTSQTTHKLQKLNTGPKRLRKGFGGNRNGDEAKSRSWEQQQPAFKLLGKGKCNRLVPVGVRVLSGPRVAP